MALSIALGAANQYEDRTTLWATPDLWRMENYPGHSVEQLWAALLTGYWLGVETIYVENLSYAGTGDRHEDARGTTGSLIHWEDAETYRPTAYGKAYQDFIKRYVPENPRPYDWRDYDPKVAIIRLPDGSWGQGELPGDAIYPSRNRLLGNPDLPTDEISREWLYVWPLLTHRVIRPGALSLWNWMVYGSINVTPSFIPMDSVTVFDHLVRGPILDNIELFIVCGHALSEQTYSDVARRVKEGATCIISRRLYAQHADGTLPGDWLVVEDFKENAEVAEKVKPFLGPADVMRFRFKEHTVEFRKGEKPGALQSRLLKR